MSPAGHKQRSVGLSKHRGPRTSLLSKFRDRPAPARAAEKDDMDDPEGIRRLPEPGTDSDDSDSIRHSQRNQDITSFKFAKAPPDGIDSNKSSIVGTRRRNLTSSTAKLAQSRPNSSPASSEQSGLRPKSKPPANSNGTRTGSRAESPPSSAGSKRPADEDVGGEHLNASMQAAKKKKPSATYGKPAHKPPQPSASKPSSRAGLFPFVATYLG